MNLRPAATLRLLFLVLILACLPAAADGRDITFVVLSDTHYGLSQWDDNDAPVKQVIDRINRLAGTPLPPSAGGEPLPPPRGVIIAGDLTDSGTSRNWAGTGPLLGSRSGFEDDCGVLGDKRLKFPAYEGYGNHDLQSREQAYVLNKLKKRNAQRTGVTVSKNGYHYSWDWDDVHFVQLNLYPGGPGPARNSLAFLREDLHEKVGHSRRPVVIIQHYGFDVFSLNWWTDAERNSFFQVIKDFNIVAIFHGHNHELTFQQWKKIPTFSSGVARRQEFLAVRIREGQVTVAAWAGEGWHQSRQFAID